MRTSEEIAAARQVILERQEGQLLTMAPTSDYALFYSRNPDALGEHNPNL